MYPNLIDSLKKRKITQKQMATLLGWRHPNTIYHKNYISGYTIQEALLVHKTYFPKENLEWLFEYVEV